MRYLRNFLLAVTLVFVAIALGNAALASHSQSTSGAWLVFIDWDRAGNADMNTAPIRFDTAQQCSSASTTMTDYIDAFHPDRWYLSACAYPTDDMTLDAIIDELINYFGKYFKTGTSI